MNPPHMAYQTYQEKKDEPFFKKFLKSLFKKMKRLSSPVERARFIHKQVDRHMDEVLADSFVAKNLSCKKGCTFCCHTQVAVNSDEALVMADKIIAGHPIDWNRFHKQKGVGCSTSGWESLSFDDRKCIFIDSEGACSIYSDRPSVCRTNCVISDPKNCDTSSGQGQPVQLLKTEKADMAVIAHFSVATESGTLPYMVWKAIEARSNVSAKGPTVRNLAGPSLFV